MRHYRKMAGIDFSSKTGESQRSRSKTIVCTTQDGKKLEFNTQEDFDNWKKSKENPMYDAIKSKKRRKGNRDWHNG